MVWVLEDLSKEMKPDFTSDFGGFQLKILLYEGELELASMKRSVSDGCPSLLKVKLMGGLGLKQQNSVSLS